MTTITYGEQQLMALYNSAGTRSGLIGKLEAMTEEDYAALVLIPDFDEG